MFSNNLIKDFTDAFVDPANGNLHLKNAVTDVIDKGIPLLEVKEDFDSELRGDRPDIGADEFNN